jgi:hypothetical protein
MRQRDHREHRVLAMLRRREHASALEIGTAALVGEPRAKRIPRSGKAAIELQIAVGLVRRGLAWPTPDNRFKLLREHGAHKPAVAH